VATLPLPIVDDSDFQWGDRLIGSGIPMRCIAQLQRTQEVIAVEITANENQLRRAGFAW
jgi:hypothetical protein